VGSTTQQWVTGLNPGSIYAYTIQNVSSQLYLDVSGNSPWPGAAIDTWYYTGGQNQYFSAI
jgi:Ricin-type beta-trefoil lectin domain-like